MTKSEILENLINYYSNGNKAQFAVLLGVKPQTINTWIVRNSFDIDLIYAKCEGLSGDWLLSGEGNMLKSNNENLLVEEIDSLKEEIRRLKEIKTPEKSSELYELCRELISNYKQRDCIIDKLVLMTEIK